MALATGPTKPASVRRMPISRPGMKGTLEGGGYLCKERHRCSTVERENSYLMQSTVSWITFSSPSPA